MSKSALTVLREARELISDPKRWTQGKYARDENGNGLWPTDANGVCFCAIGAVRKITGERGLFASEVTDGPIRALGVAAESLFGSDAIAVVNDSRGHAAVLRMFDAAIAAEEAGAR